MMLTENRNNAEQQLRDIAARMDGVIGRLAGWGKVSETNPSRLGQLQSLLSELDALDRMASAVRPQLAGRHRKESIGLTKYEQTLRTALDEIASIERVLDAERQRMKPALDAGARGMEVRSAYARAVSSR
jgi:hypothetical protein